MAQLSTEQRVFIVLNYPWVQDSTQAFKLEQWWISKGSVFFETPCIGDVQPLPWDSNDKAIFAMLDEICIANKQNPLSMLSNMATVT
jgi:hypothetical protein